MIGVHWYWRQSGTNDPSIRSPVVDEQLTKAEARPLVGISALCALRCIGTVGWVTE